MALPQLLHYMVSKYWICSVLLVLLGCNIDDSTTYWDNGNIKNKGQISNNLKEGLWVEYYTNGKLANKGNYSAGKKEGLWRIYYRNGQLHWVGEYDLDKEQGIWKEFDESGHLIKEESYHSGKKNGVHKVYYKNGRVKTLKYLTNGEIIGDYIEYYDNGRIKADGNFQKTDMSLSSILSNSEYSNIEIHIENSSKAGKWQYFYKNGNISATGDYLPYSITIVDTVETIDSISGEMVMQLTGRTIDLKNNIWKYYLDDGSLDREETYNNGELINTAKF